jgi:hypothetical protein
MNKKQWLQFAEDTGREYALSFRPCFAKYSTKTYVKRFSQDRYVNWKDSLLEKGIEIPSNWEDSIKKTFTSTFNNLTLDYIDKLPESTNPFVVKALKELKGKN